MIIFIPEEKSHFFVIDCWSCKDDNSYYCIEYYNHDLKRIEPVYSNEIEIIDRALDNYFVDIEPGGLAMEWKYLEKFDYYEMLEYGNREEYERLHNWFIQTKEYEKVINLNRGLLNPTIEAVPLEKPWVQCPEYADAFEARLGFKYLECPKCEVVLINPYFNEES